MTDTFGLYLILTNPVAGYERTAETAVVNGVSFLQLRMKGELKSEILRTARTIRAITLGTGTRFIVNDLVDIAAAVDADGVHLGQDDMPVAEARRLWTAPGKIFGLSTHSEFQARAAISHAPDYIGVGPIFPTPMKEKPDPVLGLETMGAIIDASPLTCVAVGGINRANLPSVLAHGAKNFAVVRAVSNSCCPSAAIRELMDVWKNHMKGKAAE